MSTKSPLRYPGGKTRAIAILKRFLQTAFPSQTCLLSPFLGGGSFELHMTSLGYTVMANDLFAPLATFWDIAKTDKVVLEAAIRKHMPMTKEKFALLRNTIGSLQDPVEIAAAYYVINRSSFSGSTFCGGFSSQAATGRLNESSLSTLRSLSLEKVILSSKDAIEFLNDHPETTNTVVYADPPYYISTYLYGKDGDLHESFDHEEFAKTIRERNDWMLSYNDCPWIRELYNGCQIIPVKWSYGMNAKKASSEVLILPSDRPLPSS